MALRDYQPVRQLDVWYQDDGERSHVGSLVADDGGRVYFQYDDAWRTRGHELSPFLLRRSPDIGGGPAPWRRHGRLHSLHPLFTDSLPDQWGLQLMDGAFRARDIGPQYIGDLDRLAYLGDGTMGALTYSPALKEGVNPGHFTATLEDLASAAEHVRTAYAVAAGAEAAQVDLLRAAGGGSGGAEAKALVALDNEGRVVAVGANGAADGATQVLLKFSSRTGDADAGAVEHAYAEMARAAGVTVPDTRLIATADEVRHFAITRFDRTRTGERRHVSTYASIAGVSIDAAGVDYDDLLRAALSLTRDARAVSEVIRRMAFNLAAGNDDDHAKNISFLMDPSGEWSVAPAYDLTHTPRYAHSRCMAVLGEEAGITWDRAATLAVRHGVSYDAFGEIRAQVAAAVERWPEFAESAEVPVERRDEIAAALEARRRELEAVHSRDRDLLRGALRRHRQPVPPAPPRDRTTG